MVWIGGGGVGTGRRMSGGYRYEEVMVGTDRNSGGGYR